MSYILLSADRQTRKDLLKPLPPVPQHLDCSLRSAGIQSKCPSCPLQPINMSPLPSAPIKISLKRYAYQSTFLSSAHLICRYIYYKYVDFKVGQRRPAGKQHLQAQVLRGRVQTERDRKEESASVNTVNTSCTYRKTHTTGTRYVHHAGCFSKNQDKHIRV